MKQVATKTLGAFSLITALNLGSVGVYASADKNPFDDEELKPALQSAFTVPLKFSTDFGELSLTITNDPKEEDVNYIRPHLMNPSSFLEMSHRHFLRRIELSLMEAMAGMAQLGQGDDLSGMVPSCMRSMPGASEPTLRGPTQIQQAFEPVNKRSKVLMDNAIYPIKYQMDDYWMNDKYAFPNSVITLEWTFEKTDDEMTYADLGKFNDATQFYSYIQSRLFEAIKEKAEELRNRKFRDEVRPFMFL